METTRLATSTGTTFPTHERRTKPKMRSIRLFAITATFVGCLLLAATAQAQLQTGNLYGTVSDDKGAALPGVRWVVGTDEPWLSASGDGKGRARA